MLLDTHDPATTWRYAERYLGGGTRTYSPYAADLEISPEYHPQHGAGRFTVPTFWVPADGWCANSIDSPLCALYRDGDAMLLPVHPETLRFPGLYRRADLDTAGPPLEVTSSGNARTVFVERVDGQAVPPHFVKLHYPRRLSRFTRRLRRPVIELQLWVADDAVRHRRPLPAGGRRRSGGGGPGAGVGFPDPGGAAAVGRVAALHGARCSPSTAPT